MHLSRSRPFLAEGVPDLLPVKTLVGDDRVQRREVGWAFRAKLHTHRVQQPGSLVSEARHIIATQRINLDPAQKLRLPPATTSSAVFGEDVSDCGSGAGHDALDVGNIIGWVEHDSQERQIASSTPRETVERSLRLPGNVSPTTVEARGLAAGVEIAEAIRSAEIKLHPKFGVGRQSFHQASVHLPIDCFDIIDHRILIRGGLRPSFR